MKGKQPPANGFVSIKNWEKFQHYKTRNPPWIKLYHEILDDYAYGCLQDASKLLLVSLFLLASRTENRIPADPVWIRNKAMLEHTPDLQPLVTAGFLVCDSKTLATCKQNACLETETETENTLSCKQHDPTPPEKEKNPKTKIPYKQIIDALNEATGSAYRHTTKATQALIRARWNDGFRLEDFKAVIVSRVSAWASDPDMAQYLRPQTLFGTKFESYLQSGRVGLKAEPTRQCHKLLN